MIESETRPSAVLKAGGMSCAGIVVLLILFIGGLILTFHIERATPPDFPRVKPETMAHRVSGYSQDAFAALGLHRTLEPNAYDMKKGIENTLDSDYCYPDGLESIADEPEKGAYRIYHHWSLGEVSKSEGTAALRRLRDHLKTKGWRVTQFEDDARRHERTLEAERDGGYQISLAYRRVDQRLAGGSAAPCATNPDWKESEGLYEEPEVGRPPVLTARPGHSMPPQNAR